MLFAAKITTKDYTEYWVVNAATEEHAMNNIIDSVYTATEENTEIRALDDCDVVYIGCNYEPLI